MSELPMSPREFFVVFAAFSFVFLVLCGGFLFIRFLLLKFIQVVPGCYNCRRFLVVDDAGWCQADKRPVIPVFICIKSRGDSK